MAFWGIEIKPGKPHLHQYDDERGRLHLSQATLGSGSSKEKAVVVCNVGDKKPIYLCSLLPKKMETCSLNIEFEEYDEVTFSVEGPHSIHLSGFFYGEKPDSDDEDDYESDSDEEGIIAPEMDMDSEDDSDFNFDEADDLTDNEMDMMPNSGVRIEEIVDEENPATEKATPAQSKKNKQGQIVVKKSNNVPEVESEDEDGFLILPSDKDKASVPVPESKQVSEVSIGKGQNGQVKRKKGKDDSEHTAKRKKDDSVTGDDPISQPENVAAVSTPETDAKKSKKKKKNKKVKETQESGDNNKNVAQKEEINQEKTPVKETKSESKEKSTSTTKKDSKVKTETKASQVRTFPNGLVIEEIQMGKPNGKRADPGKKISMRYIGKLQKNGKIFDSNIGKAPFKFRLGVGEVIAGWDVGVKGMRVGDKRRLTIPPAMGYGSKGAGSAIPPNAWLVFDVELIDVN
ncbi:peptidyl-prolyl cis-trans isomerase FKBP53 [Lactuca sativa]|uniref:FK506-binding protein n=1 Tax=Lactuca sativa TaxID=4236 RepID=A0A9R1UIX1_LACSA|nr:peptidyl-prolyl cis-trans isomerase FKBP53 [Lactuca sativa]KAJ0188101.1 hypothetical protein LSAT_V11C900478070 [Lactuca sativa]